MNMIWWVILIEAAVFAGIFTVIVLTAAYSDKRRVFITILRIFRRNISKHMSGWTFQILQKKWF